MSSPVRTVLALHGYSQNASVFSKRLGALRKECGNSGIELVFLDAPIVLQPVDLVGASPQALDASLQAAEVSPVNEDPALKPRGWWKSNKERTQAVGLAESLTVVRDTLKARRFDGVLGFSQGAAFAAVIAALLERPHLYPPFLVDGQPPHPPFQFCISVSGFKANDPLCNPFFEPFYSTPTLHILGKTDVIVVEERSRALIQVSSNKRVEEHEGGHFLPSKGPWRKFLRDYMKDPTADIASPNGISVSNPNSGTATPTGAGTDSAVLMKL